MNYEQKYLKYKEKYLALKAKLGDASSSSNNTEKKVKITQIALEKNNRNISVLEQAIKGRINRIRNTEDQKKRGIENLTKNNAPKTEIDEVIKSYDDEINGVKKEIEIKTRELEQQRKLLQKNTIKLNELKQN
jgi:hypothetical protein